MVAAVVILFHPDLPLLQRLIESVKGQVDAIVAVDNTPGVSNALLSFFQSVPSSVSYLPLGENMGIAEAQNIGIRKCMDEGFSHVLLLDQDSEPCPGMVNRMLAVEKNQLSKGKRIAAIAPQIVDGKTDKFPCATRYRWFGVEMLYRNGNSTEPIQTDNVMASGSLIRISVLQTLGMMRSDLFIDHVDTEWALRARMAGYDSYGVPDAVLLHSIGDTTHKILGKYIHFHSDLRHYYQLRNEVYLARLKTMGWQWRAYILPRIPYHFVLYSILSKHRLSASCLLLRAIRDGVFARLGPLPRNSAKECNEILKQTGGIQAQ